MTDTKLQIQETQQTQNKINNTYPEETKSKQNKHVGMFCRQRTEDKEKILKAIREEKTYYTQRNKDTCQKPCKPEDNEVTSLKCSKKNKTAYKK